MNQVTCDYTSTYFDSDLAALEKKERERQFKSSKAINERDKEIRGACCSTAQTQIKDIVSLTEKYLLEDDERIAVSDLLEIEFNHNDDLSIKLLPYFMREKTWPDAALGKLLSLLLPVLTSGLKENYPSQMDLN